MQPSLAVCIGSLVVAFAYAVASRNALCTAGMNEELIRFANKSTIWTLGAIVWPVVWSVFVGIDVLDRTPLAIIGLLWPPFLLALDLVWVTESSDTAQSKQTLSYDGSAISSLAFALGGLLLANVGEGFARAASPILTACIFLILAFVIPTPGLKSGTFGSSAIVAVQKVCLGYCVGLLLTAVCINLHIGLHKYKGSQATLLSKAMTDLAPEPGKK